jgi:hypothetical protein
MDPSNYELPRSLSYLTLLSLIFQFFREVNSFDDFVSRIGLDYLTNVTDLPEFQIMDAASSLPHGFTERIYQFCDLNVGNGIMDVAFFREELVNVRAQIFFKGWFAKSKAKKYLWNTLVPAFLAMFGEPTEKGDEYCSFRTSGIIGVARYVSGTPALSTYITDERYWQSW